LGIDAMRKHARTRGGQCLSDVYVNRQGKLLWECQAGHVWQVNAGHVVFGGRWCPSCARLSLVNGLRSNIEAMQELARARGGRCLSASYRDAKTHLTWECREGHAWQATPNNVKNKGSWCPQCAILDRIRAKNQEKRKRYTAPS